MFWLRRSNPYTGFLQPAGHQRSTCWSQAMCCTPKRHVTVDGELDKQSSSVWGPYMIICSNKAMCQRISSNPKVSQSHQCPLSAASVLGWENILQMLRPKEWTLPRPE